MAIMRYDPTKGIFAWPRWLDEFDDQFLTQTSQRGLRIHETEKSIVVDAVVAGVPSGQVEVNIEDGVLKPVLSRAPTDTIIPQPCRVVTGTNLLPTLKTELLP
jgi:HSP20 family molecular chaperone IbpA